MKFLILAVLSLIITTKGLAQTGSTTTKLQELVQDDFSSDKYSFKLTAPNVKISNGKLTITSTTGELELASCRTILKYDEDFYITADVKHSAGVADRGYGLKAGGKDDYVNFLIAGDYFMITGSKLISAWKQNSSIHTGENATNNLSIKRSGSQLNFYINDVLAYTDSISFTEYNIVGFVVLDNQTVDFDNVVVKGVKR